MSTPLTTLGPDALARMDKLARVQLINSLPGPKPMALVGTIDSDGKTNLAPFSSVTHFGSNPPLIGLVSRPDLTERHTLSNIKQDGSYTINLVHRDILAEAHHCSARYPRDISEFTASSLSPHFEPGIRAPFVAESRLRYALELVELLPIQANGTALIIGRVVLVQVAQSALAEDGAVDLFALGVVASTALDTYFDLASPTRLAYAKPRLLIPETA